MIPTGTSILNAPVEAQEQPSLTWKLDMENKRITKMVNDIEAVKQSVFKILSTERFNYLIYSFNYGAELDGLIGSSPIFIQSELKRRITEALLQDDRITTIQNFQVSFMGENAIATFTAVSVFGNFQVDKVVNPRV